MSRRKVLYMAATEMPRCSWNWARPVCATLLRGVEGEMREETMPMTTPDHRPYLTDTDLRTPEDVLAWLGACEYWFTTGASLALAARLDRERRQACRRAALLHFRDAAGYMRDYRVQISDGGVFDSVVERLIEDALTRALAFRAAARMP